jgi:hypothetical protein
MMLVAAATGAGLTRNASHRPPSGPAKLRCSNLANGHGSIVGSGLGAPV